MRTRTTHLWAATTLTILTVWTASTTSAGQSLESPEYISHQGFLSDDEGNPLTGFVQMTLALYDGTHKVWEEVQDSVVVTDGLFEAQLGSVAPFDTLSFRRPYFLGIKIGTDPEISPRSLLSSTPYALNLRGIRVEPNWTNKDAAPAIIGGDRRNGHAFDVEGVTISGGGGFDDIDIGYQGLFNYASARFATIGGGLGNTAGQWSTVAGGARNLGDDYYTAVGGGLDNSAEGFYATVPGGRKNVANGEASFAAGQGAQALHPATFVWNSTTSNNDTFSSTASHQFLIDASGGVGIGTNAPANPLSVNGNADFSGNVGIQTADPLAALHIQTDDWSVPPAAIVSDDLVIESTDAVIAAYSPRIGSWGSALVLGEVDGGVLATKWSIVRQAGISPDLVFRFGTQPDHANQATKFVIQDQDAMVRFYGHAVPNVTNARDLGTSSIRWRNIYLENLPATPSDLRLKTDVMDLTYGLDEVMKLRPVSYKRKGRSGDGGASEGENRLGLIAQETDEVIPEVVQQPDSTDGYLSIRYSELIPVLIKAIQEQQKRIEELEARVIQ